MWEWLLGEEISVVVKHGLFSHGGGEFPRYLINGRKESTQVGLPCFSGLNLTAVY